MGGCVCHNLRRGCLSPWASPPAPHPILQAPPSTPCSPAPSRRDLSWASGTAPTAPAAPGIPHPSPPPSQRLLAAGAHFLGSPKPGLSAASVHAAPRHPLRSPRPASSPFSAPQAAADLRDRGPPGGFPRCKSEVAASPASAQPCTQGSVTSSSSWRACPFPHEQPRPSWSLSAPAQVWPPGPVTGESWCPECQPRRWVIARPQGSRGHLLLPRSP